LLGTINNHGGDSGKAYIKLNILMSPCMLLVTFYKIAGPKCKLMPEQQAAEMIRMCETRWFHKIKM